MLIAEEEHIGQHLHVAQGIQDLLEVAIVSHHTILSTIHSLLFSLALCSGSNACQNGGTCIRPNTCCCTRTGYAGPRCNNGKLLYCFICI